MALSGVRVPCEDVGDRRAYVRACMCVCVCLCARAQPVGKVVASFLFKVVSVAKGNGKAHALSPVLPALMAAAFRLFCLSLATTVNVDRSGLRGANTCWLE